MTKTKNHTELEELSDEQLEAAHGGAEPWNGKDKFPHKTADRSFSKSDEILSESSTTRIVATGGGSDILKGSGDG